MSQFEMGSSRWPLATTRRAIRRLILVFLNLAAEATFDKEKPMKNRYRSIWLRQGGSSNPGTSGKKHRVMLSAIGNAAARETLVTATPHMAAIWTDLFDSLLAPNCSGLCWRGNGPGIGRDAYTAYSGLLGRYMARAYLTEHERVRVLVPLDEAKRRLQGTPYVIKKDPLSRGYEADWIGLDDSGLVIVEAKGTYDKGIKTWHGPCLEPPVLQTAIKQAKKTAIFRSNRKLSAKRWAIASRWGTKENRREPTLLAWEAWDPKEEQLDEDDYQYLDKILHHADVGGVLNGMWHTQAPNVEELIADFPPIELKIDNRPLEDGPGFVAMVGPFGVHPLRTRDEGRNLLRQLRDLNFSYAVASLSHSYVERYIAKATIGELTSHANFKDASEPFVNRRALTVIASRYGLTVVWPHPDENVAFD